MSYLLKLATRRPAPARVDEKLLLNLAGFHGGAYVRVFVGDTSAQRVRRGIPEPRIRLRIADCDNTISLWFELDSAENRENSLFKIDTLLGSLHRFRDALAAEAEDRAVSASRKEVACRT